MTLAFLTLNALPFGPAAAQDAGPSTRADETAIPAPGTAASLLGDPVLSPLLDHHYQGAKLPARPPAFQRPRRNLFDQRFRIVLAARLEPGMRVADLRANTDAFTALVARAVGAQGVVYAVVTAPGRVAELQAIAKVYRVDNIVPIIDTGEKTQLPAEGVDLAFLAPSEQDLKQPRAVLDSIHQALIPFGSLIVIGNRLRSTDRSAWNPHQVRAERDGLIDEVLQAGFRLVEEPRFLTDSYVLRFEKLSDEPNVEVGPIESAAPGTEP